MVSSMVELLLLLTAFTLSEWFLSSMVELSELVGQESSSSSSVGLVAYRLLPLSLVVTSGLGLGSCLSTSRLSSTTRNLGLYLHHLVYQNLD